MRASSSKSKSPGDWEDRCKYYILFNFLRDYWSKNKVSASHSVVNFGPITTSKRATRKRDCPSKRKRYMVCRVMLCAKCVQKSYLGTTSTYHVSLPTNGTHKGHKCQESGLAPRMYLMISQKKTLLVREGTTNTQEIRRICTIRTAEVLSIDRIFQHSRTSEIRF